MGKLKTLFTHALRENFYDRIESCDTYTFTLLIGQLLSHIQFDKRYTLYKIKLPTLNKCHFGDPQGKKEVHRSFQKVQGLCIDSSLILSVNLTTQDCRGIQPICSVNHLFCGKSSYLVDFQNRSI